MCAATGIGQELGERRSQDCSVSRRSLSPCPTGCPPNNPAPDGCPPPPTTVGQFPLVVIALLRQFFLCLSARLRWSGEGVRPGVVVSPGPLSQCRCGGGRGWSQGGRLGKARFWVPRATRGFASVRLSSHALPVSCRSGPSVVSRWRPGVHWS